MNKWEMPAPNPLMPISVENKKWQSAVNSFFPPFATQSTI